MNAERAIGKVCSLLTGRLRAGTTVEGGALICRGVRTYNTTNQSSVNQEKSLLICRLLLGIDHILDRSFAVNLAVLPAQVFDLDFIPPVVMEN